MITSFQILSYSSVTMPYFNVAVTVLQSKPKYKQYGYPFLKKFAGVGEPKSHRVQTDTPELQV
jgi:hypothetical protein